MLRTVRSVSYVKKAFEGAQKLHQSPFATLSFPSHLFVEEGAHDEESLRRQTTAASKTASRPRAPPDSLSSTYFDSARLEYHRKNRQQRDTVEEFRTATREHNVAALHATYDELRKQMICHRKPSQASTEAAAQSLASFSPEDLRAAMQIIVGPLRLPFHHNGRVGKERASDAVRRRSRSDGRLVQLMFADYEEVFGFTVQSEDCSLALSGLILQGADMQGAWDYFNQLLSAFRQCFAPSATDWLNILGLFRGGQDVSIAAEAWKQAVAAGGSVDADVRDQYLQILLKVGDVVEARQIAFEGPAESRIYEPESSTRYSSFLEAACRAGVAFWRQLSYIADALHKQLHAPGSSGSLAEWHALLIYTGLTKGGQVALQMCSAALTGGLIRPDAKTFNVILLSHAKELDEIAAEGAEEDVTQLFGQIQQGINVAPDRHSYSIGISTVLGKAPSLLYKGSGARERHRTASQVLTRQTGVHQQKEHYKQRLETVLGATYTPIRQEAESLGSASMTSSIPKFSPGQIHEAGLLYRNFRATGLHPDSGMVNPLILAYTRSYVPSLDKAMELYDDLRRGIMRQNLTSGDAARSSITRGIYDVLLHACAQARDSLTAARLIHDMVEDEVSLGQNNAANLTVLLIQASTSHEAAYQVYEQMRNAAVNINQLGRSTKSGSDVEGEERAAPFDRQGWLHIIRSFTKLRFEKQVMPPIEYVLEVVSDMMQHGFLVDARLYSTLLHYYGLRASVFPESREELQGVVIDLHSHLQRNSIEPDLTLVTSLMDAYNRVGLSRQAMEIWRRLMLSNTLIDSACIAVVLDTCGHSGRLAEARQVWSWVRRNPTQAKACDKGAWDSYIECLARCGRLQEAVDLMFDAMQPELEQRGGATVDRKTSEMLLRFASNRHHHTSSRSWWRRAAVHDGDEEGFPILSELKARLQREMPAVWDDVKDIPIALR